MRFHTKNPKSLMKVNCALGLRNHQKYPKKTLHLFAGGLPDLLQYYEGGGGGPQYISILLRGSLGTPYLYYAVYGRPLSPK